MQASAAYKNPKISCNTATIETSKRLSYIYLRSLNRSRSRSRSLSPMSAGNRDKIILISGINGYIATHIGLQLLQRGYTVRGTSRSSSAKDHLIAGAFQGYDSQYQRKFQDPSAFIPNWSSLFSPLAAQMKRRRLEGGLIRCPEFARIHPISPSYHEGTRLLIRARRG